MNDVPGMEFSAEVQTYRFDIERMGQTGTKSTTTTPGDNKFRLAALVYGVRGSIFAAGFARNNVVPVGPMSEASWLAHVELPPDVRPKVGDQLTNIVYIRTGRPARWETLRVVFVQVMTPDNYHLWLKEDLVK